MGPPAKRAPKVCVYQSFGPRMDGLEVEPYYVSLDDSPEYTAYSYTWGDVSNQAPIIVNGQPFTITAKLANLLKGLRRTTSLEAVSVWGDAICISQGDPVERGLQVRWMKYIYERATVVMGLLQPEDDTDNDGLCCSPGCARYLELLRDVSA